MRYLVVTVLLGMHFNVGCDCGGFHRDATVAITTPDEGAFINAAMAPAVVLTGECSNSGLPVTLSGAGIGKADCVDNAWTATIDVTEPADGPIAIHATHFGAETTRILNKDSTLPTVTITPIVGPITTPAGLDLSGTCSEEGQAIVISGDGTGIATCTNGTWTVHLADPITNEGNETYLADHADLAGNRARTASITVTRVYGTPEVSFTMPAADAYINLSNVTAFTVQGLCQPSGQPVTLSGGLTATSPCAAGAWSSTNDYSAVADGPVTLNANHQNSLQMPAPSATRRYIKDTVAPTVTIMTSAGGSLVTALNQSMFPISGTCTDDGPIAISGAATGTVTCTAGTWATTIDLTAAASGPLTLTATGNDAAGNPSAPANLSITKSVANVQVAITSPAANSYVNAANQGAFAVAGTCSESGQLVNVTGSAFGTAPGCVAGMWSALLNFNTAPEGAVSITVNHQNSTGTAATPAMRTFIKDTVLPTLTLNSAPAVTAANQAAFQLSGSCSENGQSVSFSGSASGTASCVNGAWTASLNLTALPEGPINFAAFTTDVAGNQSTMATLSITKNLTLPGVAVTVPANNTYVNASNAAAFVFSGTCTAIGQPVELTMSVSATTSCLTGGVWSVTVDFSAVPDGPIVTRTDHHDAMGNYAVPSISSLTKDVVIPALANAAVTNPSPTNSVTYALSYGAITNGPFTQYCIQENNPAVGTCVWVTSSNLPSSFTVTPVENVKALTIWMRDAAGNVSAPTYTNAVTLQTTPPTLASLTVTNTSPTNSATYNLVWGAISSTATQYCVRLNSTVVGGCAWLALPPANTFSVGTSETANVLSAWVRDGAGNVSTRVDANSVTYDATPPTLTTVRIENGSPTATRRYLLTYLGLSESISQYCILENNVAVGNCTWTTAPQLPAYYQVTTANNAKTLTVWTRDVAGNTQAVGTNSNTVTYNNTLLINPTSATLTGGLSFDSIEGQRANVSAVMLPNGKILFAGGCNINSNGANLFYAVAKLYDPVADTWTPAGQMSVPRCMAATALLSNGNVLVAGGLQAGGNSTPSADLYNPATNTWTQADQMGTSRAGAVATTLPGGKVLVSGGFTNSAANARNTTEIYDSVADVWIAGPTMNSVRFQHQAVRLQDDRVVLIAGGITLTDSTATVDIFTPTGHTGTIAAGPPLSQKRGAFNAVLLSNLESPTGSEAILVLGGYDGVTYRANVDLFTGSAWVAKTPITGARGFANATKLNDGTIFVAHGRDTAGVVANTGVYTPKGAAGAGTWTAKATPSIASISASALLLANGRVLNIFGESYTGAGVPNIWDPVANTWNAGGTLHAAYPSYGQFQGPHLQLATGKILHCGWRSNLVAETAQCQLIDPQQGTVLPTADQKTPVSRAFGPLTELADGRVFTVGGSYYGFSQALNTAEIFDPVANTWTMGTGTTPGYGYGAQTVLLPGNRVLITGGWSGPAYNNFNFPTTQVLIYTVATDSFALAPGQLPTPRIQHALLSTPGGRIFLYGGSTGAVSLSSLLEWNDATSTWITKAPSTVARQGPAVTYIPGGSAGRLLVAGGHTTFDANATGTTEVYDIGTNTWSAGPPLPAGDTTAQTCASYIPQTNQVMMVGNYLGTGNVSALYTYSVTDNTWTASAPFTVAVPGGGSQFLLGKSCATLPDGRFWSAGGEYAEIHLVSHMAAPVQFTARRGSGVYTWSVFSGTGTLDARHLFTPAFPLATGSTVIRVDDGAGQTASATVTVP